MEKRPFNVVYMVDDNPEQLIMLRMSLITLQMYIKVDSITVMHANVSEMRIRPMLDDVNYGMNGINYYPFDYATIDQMFPALPNAKNKRLYYPSLMRWFIGRLPLKDCWYFDTDVLFSGDIVSQFLQVQKKGHLIAAFNRKVYSHGYKQARIGEYRHTSDPNAGIMYWNLQEWNSKPYLKEVLEYYATNAKHMKYVNQSALGWFMDTHRSDCYVQIDDHINLHVWDISRYEEQMQQILVHHFTGEDKSLMYRVFNDIIRKKYAHKEEI